MKIQRFGVGFFVYTGCKRSEIIQGSRQKHKTSYAKPEQIKKTKGVPANHCDECMKSRVNGEFNVDSCIDEMAAMGLRLKVFEVDHYTSWELRTVINPASTGKVFSIK